MLETIGLALLLMLGLGVSLVPFCAWLDDLAAARVARRIKKGETK